MRGASVRWHGRLILLLAIGAVVPLAVSMTLALVSFTQVQSHEIERRQVEIARSAAVTIAAIVDTVEAQLTLLSQAADYSTDERRPRAATDLLKVNDGIESVSVLGLDGRELLRHERYDVIGEAELRDAGDSPHFRVTQSGQTYVGPVTFSRFNEPVATVAVPVRDLRGNVQNVLAARFNLKVMWDVLGTDRCWGYGLRVRHRLSRPADRSPRPLTCFGGF